MKKNRNGKIIISSGVKNVLPWEMHSAIALKEIGRLILVNKSGEAIDIGSLV